VAVLEQFLNESGLSLPLTILRESVALNEALLKQPFRTEDWDIDLSWNLWEFYQAALQREKIPLEEKPGRYHIDRTAETWFSWDDWCREVVWYGNKKGAYLYGNTSVGPQMAGHY
jgi:hypothetical protein